MVEHLPIKRDGVGIIVSAMVGAKIASETGRTDIFSVGKPIRDGDGNVIGCQGLIAYHYTEDGDEK